MKTSAVLVSLTAPLVLAPLAAQPPPRPAPPPCEPADGYICGQQGPEDLVALGSDWAVASAFSGSGGITLIRTSDRMSHTAYPSDTAVERLDASTYPDCPGPPSAGAFTTHGLYVAPGEGPVHELFVVGHGARESIEVFEVDTSEAMPAVTWTGCAIAPDPIGLNSVRGLPDGGFLTTNFNPRDTPMQQMMSGEPNGELWEWHTASGWEKVPGSEASGANGVELSDDGRTLYIAAWGSQSFIRLSRSMEPPVREEVPLGSRIDNIHWARDGRLLGVGQVGQDWQVVKIDPESLDVEQIFEQPDMPAFGGGTVALEVGDDLWVGSFRGDRIAVVPLP
ncbi:MAG TPA: hypothetical protein VMR74_14760 [Gammaproteobacteria bacterium]|nr:hypothetical protein [Gammaproteobacteria bacterium]